MAKLFLPIVFIIAASAIYVSAQDEFLQVNCKLFAKNHIRVRLTKDSATKAVKVFNDAAPHQKVAVFRSHMKDKVKNIHHVNNACPFGWIGEDDFKQAVDMFTEGIEEVKHKVNNLQDSPYPFLYLNTWRYWPYNKDENVFNIGY